MYILALFPQFKHFPCAEGLYHSDICPLRAGFKPWNQEAYMIDQCLRSALFNILQVLPYHKTVQGWFIVSKRKLCKYLPWASAVQWANVEALLLHCLMNQHLTFRICSFSKPLTRLHRPPFRSNEYSHFFYSHLTVSILSSTDPCEICANPPCPGCLDWGCHLFGAGFLSMTIIFMS